MDYKEYAFEGGLEISIEPLKSGFIPKEEYLNVHRDTAIVCVDVLIWYNNGWVLIKRNNYPAFGEEWVIGGRLPKGIPAEDFIIKKSKEECNLEITDLKFVNIGRTYFKTDPFNHGKGTDTISLMYLAKGNGVLKVDNLHTNYTIITPENFKDKNKSLHPYVVDFIKLDLLEKSNTS